MKLIDARPPDKAKWNEFVALNFPPMGAFFQSWEWGEFQQALGYHIRRIILIDDNNKKWLGAALAIRHALALGFSYYYLPRGPVLQQTIWEDNNQAESALRLIREDLTRNDPKCVFLRMEPALENPPQIFTNKPSTKAKYLVLGKSFVLPKTYVQPRFSSIISLDKTKEEIFASFSKEMRNIIRKAEQNLVSVELKHELSESEWLEFSKMRRETALRTRKNIYPQDEKYFREIVKIMPSTIFAAYHGGVLAGINIIIFFSQTATYLFSAARADKLVFKVSPYLVWHSILESQKRGLKYYDLGGIDERLWPTLTHFKSQFKGKEISYMGNADAVIKPTFYFLYKNTYPLIKKLLAKIRGRKPTR